MVLQPANLHGDITLQLPADTALAPVVLDCDEYSNARVGQAHTRYSRLGAKQRASETPGGLTLMGVRLHNPASGRFLSVDPGRAATPAPTSTPTRSPSTTSAAGSAGSAAGRKAQKVSLSVANNKWVNRRGKWCPGWVGFGVNASRESHSR